MARPPLSVFVLDFFPDGYDVYGLVYVSSDTDSGKDYGEVSDEDYVSFDEAEKEPTDSQNVKAEDHWSPSSIGPYLSSPREEDEIVADDENESQKMPSPPKSSSKPKKIEIVDDDENKSQKMASPPETSSKSKKKCSPSPKKLSTSESALLKPSLKSITKEKLRKKGKQKTVSLDNEVQESSSLKRKRSSSEGEHTVKKQFKDIPENFNADSSEKTEKYKPTFENISEDMIYDQLSPTKTVRHEKDMSCNEGSVGISVDNVFDNEVKNVSSKENSEMLQSVQLSPEKCMKNISEGNVRGHPSPMKMVRREKDMPSHENPTAMSADIISDNEAEITSSKENAEVLQSVQLSSEEVIPMSRDNDSNKCSSRKNIETERYFHKEVSEDSSGTLADDESDHDEEKTNLRNNAYVENYRKCSAIEIASEKHTGNTSSSEEACESSTERNSKNISKISCKRNLKEILYKEKCKEDPEYPSNEANLRKRLKKTINKKRKCFHKQSSMQLTPGKNASGNPGTCKKCDRTKRNSKDISSKSTKRKKRIKKHKYISKRDKWKSKQKRKKYNLTKWEKKACRRQKLFKLFAKHAELHNTREIEMEEEENESNVQAVNLSTIPSDEYYIDNFEFSDNVGAEACIGKEEEILHENDDQALGREASENQLSNSQTSENQSRNSVSDRNSSIFGDYKGFRQPIAHIRYRQQSEDQSSAIQQCKDLWSRRRQSDYLTSGSQQVAYRISGGQQFAYQASGSQQSTYRMSGGQQSAYRTSGDQQSADGTSGVQHSEYGKSGGQESADGTSGGQQSAAGTSGGQLSVNGTLGSQQFANQASDNDSAEVYIDDEDLDITNDELSTETLDDEESDSH